MGTEYYFFLGDTQGQAVKQARPAGNQVNVYPQLQGELTSGERAFSSHQQEGREGSGLRIVKSILNQAENSLCKAIGLV